MTALPNPLYGLSGEPTGVGASLAGPVPAADPSGVVGRLNALLRGELAAVDTYRDAMEKMTTAGHAVHVDALAQMQAEHGRSCQLLRQRIADLGGTPADGSGVWGVWAQAVQSTLSLIGGEIGSLRALREGEEHGQRDYETALNDVDADSAQLIQDRLLPAQQQHLATLDRMLASQTTP